MAAHHTARLTDAEAAAFAHALAIALARLAAERAGGSALLH